MDEPQIIKAPNGEELVVIPRRDYEALVSRSFEAADEQDAVLRPEVIDALRELGEGRQVLIPSEVAIPIANGARPIPLLRKWRRMTSEELSRGAGIDKGLLSRIERGAEASSDVLCRIARTLGVPVDLLAS